LSALERLGVPPELRTLPDSGTITREQAQTRDTFAFKWARRESYEQEAMQQFSREWLFQRYCAGDPQVVQCWLAGGPHIILDAGCGSGYSALLLFGDELRNHDYLGVDVSDAVVVARQRFAEAGIPADFLRANLSSIPIPDESVDVVFAEGVLHHTDVPAASFRSLARKLRRGGRFLLYVYARKAPIREFTDDHIRAQLQPLSDEEAWRALEPLTRLGKALGELGVEVTVPADIPMLGIRHGTYDLQRFFYWHFMKAFYRPEYTLEAMNHVNFDWYRPLNCHRHTPDEVRAWCANEELVIERLDVQEAGITAVARRP
jgi:arsenite methyltransferase